MNVRLRALAAADAAWADAWFPDIAASVGYHRADTASLLARAGRDARVLLRVIERERQPVGVIVATAGVPDRRGAMIEIVALAHDHARRGSGMQGAALLERELRHAGAERIYAPAPAGHGIAVYFWIRLGYHPIPRRAWPCEREGVAWMVRQLGG